MPYLLGTNLQKIVSNSISYLPLFVIPQKGIRCYKTESVSLDQHEQGKHNPMKGPRHAIIKLNQRGVIVTMSFYERQHFSFEDYI